MKTTHLTMNENGFCINGEPFDLASGDFHYFRTLPGGWAHRLRLMKAFGLNTLQTYVPWNLHEPEKGHYCFDFHLDLRAFLEACQAEGLWVMLRPSPYICSECDWGGLPYWLMQENCTPRTMDSTFPGHYETYFRRLMEEIGPMLSTKGGPIIAVSVENEYGSYGMDHDYIRWTADLYRTCGIDVPLYNTDGDNLYMLTHGGPKDIWSGINLAAVTEASVAAYRAYQTGFPIYVGEMWGGRALQWGGRFARQTADVIAERYRTALAMGAHVNFYMFCGGTSFGSFSGANYGVYRADVPGARTRYVPFPTSYDVDAPVTEDGRPTEKYFALRKVLAEHRGMCESALPPVPENRPVQTAGEIRWLTERRVFSPDILDCLTETKVISGNVRTMESLGQDYGFVLYTTHIRAAHPDYTYYVRIEGLQDRADIFTDGVYLGTYYRDRDNTPVSFRVPKDSVRLDILVENMGRICYGHKMLTEHKGILDCVILDRAMGDGKPYPCASIVTGWENRSLPFRYPQVEKALQTEAAEAPVSRTEPKLYSGTFSSIPGVDTFLSFYGRNMTKGQVWINGFAVGRYWAIGPQDTLYIPGDLLREENRIEILELYAKDTPPQAQFCDTHQLDRLTENTEVVLA
ncbi:MAG: beta-galactosidase [Clostridia bacterium]|nr:beta-galactosidase [Clostridia bacterium]